MCVICICTYTYVYECVCVICMCICMYVCVYIYIYIYISAPPVRRDDQVVAAWIVQSRRASISRGKDAHLELLNAFGEFLRMHARF